MAIAAGIGVECSVFGGKGMEDGYRETEMCRRCEGECCRRQSGHCLPSEFGSASAVRAALESGRYCIVMLFDSGIQARVVRPHYRNPEKMIGCIFQGESGCELPWAARPYGCRMLRPRDREGGHCQPEGISIEEAAGMWERSTYLPPLWMCKYP